MPSHSNRVRSGEATPQDALSDTDRRRQSRTQKSECRMQKSGQSDSCGLGTRLLTSTRLLPNRNSAPGPGTDQETEHSMVAGPDPNLILGAATDPASRSSFG